MDYCFKQRHVKYIQKSMQLHGDLKKKESWFSTNMSQRKVRL